MKFLLDTNTWIAYLKNPASNIKNRLALQSPQNIVTCSIVLAELLHGAEKYGNRTRRQATVHQLLTPFDCLPFDESDAVIYAAIRHTLKYKDKLLVRTICR